MFIQHGFQYLGHSQCDTVFVYENCSLSLHFKKLKSLSISASSGNCRGLKGKTPFLNFSWLILSLMRSKCCLDTSQGYYIMLSSTITTVRKGVGKFKNDF